MINDLLLLEIKKELENTLLSIDTLSKCNEKKVHYFGKKGVITELSSSLKDLSTEEKKEYGKKINELKVYADNLFNDLFKKLEEIEYNKQLEKERIDITLPSYDIKVGTIHPLNMVIEMVEDLFISMGYDVKSGPEVECDLFNFEMLNIPNNHPARDSQDSFYINEETLLRTQTSPVQVRTMLENKEKTAFKIICPGKVFRKDNDDATHSHQFHQIEGLVVDENISMADLKGTLEILVKRLFGEKRNIRFRPSFFPFTEPSVEVDLSCFKCGGEGCSLCKGTGWIEILGAGMVHPNVLNGCGYDTKKYSGFAFGMGVERIAMLKYEIPDIRNFYTNDVRFLEQFNCVRGDNNETK